MSVLGSEYKINVHAEPLDGIHMDDYDFECKFYASSNKAVTINKKEMIRENEDNYIALITSDIALKIGRGMLKMRFTAHLPDSDFPDKLRTEIVEVCTNVTIL